MYLVKIADMSFSINITSELKRAITEAIEPIGGFYLYFKDGVGCSIFVDIKDERLIQYIHNVKTL